MMSQPRFRVRFLAVLGAVSIGVAACGTSTDVASTDVAASTDQVDEESSAPTETPAQAPAEEAASPTPEPEPEPTEAPPSGSTIDVGAGFLTLSLPPGWEILKAPAAEIEPTVDGSLDTYSFDLDNLQRLVRIGNGNLSVFIANEPRFYTAPPYGQWRRAVVDSWQSIGVVKNVSTTLDWAGGAGDTLLGRQPNGDFIQIDTVEVEGLYFLSLALSEGDASGPELAELRGILQSVVVDRAALPALAHSVDARNFASEEVTGSTPFAASFLVPANWTVDTQDGVLYTSPDGESFIRIFLQLDTEGFDAQVERELAENGDDFLGPDPVGTVDNSGDFPVAIFWDDQPEAADAALVMASDGIIFLAAYILAPSPGLTLDVVNSLVFPTSAFDN